MSEGFEGQQDNDHNNLFINTIGDTTIITPKDALADTLRRGAEMVSDDFMIDGRPDEIVAVREEL